MAGSYNPFVNNYTFVPPCYAVDEHGQPVPGTVAYVPEMQQFPPQGPEQLNNGLLEFEGHTMSSVQGGGRARRRIGAGGEHIKFRRTRSGCFTCRNRRVKCDEARPVCERKYRSSGPLKGCRKGNRDCVYPDPTSSSKARKGSAKGKSEDIDGSSAEEESDAVEGHAAGSSKDVTGPLSATSPRSEESVGLNDSPDPPTLFDDQSPTPSTETSTSVEAGSECPLGRSSKQANPKSYVKNRKLSSLPKDVKFFLSYARNNLGMHHYGFKYQESEFLKNTLIEVALQYEPLLYAVVGFAAYHHTLSKTNARIDDFLVYYTRSVSLLRESLGKNYEPNIATLLTVLQLAEIEDYLGDWVNCVAHQAAACEILTTLFTPRTVMETETIRMIFHWYIRFDIFAGVISGNGTVLGREWFAACHEYYDEQCRRRPDDIVLKYGERWARLRLLAADVAIICAAKTTGRITDQAFTAHLNTIAEEAMNWEQNLHPVLRDRGKLITDFSGAPPEDSESIVNPYDPCVLYGGDIFMTNYLALDSMGLDLLVNHQLQEVFQGAPRSPRAQEVAYRLCQLFEAMQLYPASPPGNVLAMHAPLGIAAGFLPQDDKHNMWARRKMATVEALGYIYPRKLRMRMAEYWNADVSEWWLPNEEGLTPIIRSIHAFIAERTKEPRDKKSEDVRDMKGIFAALSLSEQSSPEAPHGAGEETVGAIHAPPPHQDGNYIVTEDRQEHRYFAQTFQPGELMVQTAQQYGADMPGDSSEPPWG